MTAKKDKTGLKFYRLTVVREGPRKVQANGISLITWVCKCECGKETIVSSANLGFSKGRTKSCGCLDLETSIKKFKGNTYSFDLQKKGTKNIKTVYFGVVKKNAAIRNLEFDITIEFMQELLEKQNFKCALTGEDIIMDHLNTAKRGRNTWNTASLDRIDSSKGYTRDNVQWVHKQVNLIKQDLTEEELLYWCERIVSHHKQKLESQQKAL